jgi:hypothetical protein
MEQRVVSTERAVQRDSHNAPTPRAQHFARTNLPLYLDRNPVLSFAWPLSFLAYSLTIVVPITKGFAHSPYLSGDTTGGICVLSIGWAAAIAFTRLGFA